MAVIRFQTGNTILHNIAGLAEHGRSHDHNYWHIDSFRVRYEYYVQHCLP